MMGDHCILLFAMAILTEFTAGTAEEISRAGSGNRAVDGGKDYQNAMVQMVQFISSLNRSMSDLSARMARLEAGNSVESFMQKFDEMLKRKMLDAPQAKLFTADRQAGTRIQDGKYNYLYYDSNNPSWKGGCYDLNLLERENVRTVIDTLGTCVRVFNEAACSGGSQAMYPGSKMAVDSQIGRVLSVGPCVSNEFEHAIWGTTEVRKIYSQVRAFKNVPDIIRTKQNRPETTGVSSDNDTVSSYVLGPGGRIDAIQGVIHSRHLASPRATEDTKLEGTKQNVCNHLALNNETEEVGYAFPLELGGPADQAYNCFVQSKDQASRYLEVIVPPIRNHLADYPKKSVRLELSFFYANSTGTRPSGLWYRGNMEGTGEIFYGYVPN